MANDGDRTTMRNSMRIVVGRTGQRLGIRARDRTTIEAGSAYKIIEYRINEGLMRISRDQIEALLDNIIFNRINDMICWPAPTSVQIWKRKLDRS